MVSTQPNPNSLQIAYWNANGLRSGRDELEEFIQKEDVAVILVSETKLRPNVRNPNIQGFTLHRTDRNDGPGGGTAVYVRNALRYHVAQTPTLQQLEATGIVVSTTNGPLRIFSCYNRPGNGSLLETDLQALFIDPTPTIAAGDFNAKSTEWNSRSQNANGRVLEAYLQRNPDVLVMAPVEPTYHNYATGTPDILDIAVMKDVNREIRLTVVDALSSDHQPVLMHIGDGVNEVPRRPHEIVDWKKFSAVAEEKFQTTSNAIHDIEDLERAVAEFEENVRSSIEAATSAVTEDRPRRRTIPYRIVRLIREKDRARRRFRRTRNPSDRTLANHLKREVRQALLEFRNEQWQKKLESLNREDNSIWRMTKVLKTDRKPVPPIHGSAGRIVYTDEEKAREFAYSLQLQCRTNITDADLDHMEMVEDQVSEIISTVPAQTDSMRTTTSSEIHGIISKLKNRKAPGPDCVSNKSLKNLPENAVAVLVGICNAVLELRHFPARWKRATVIFIPKPGKDLKFPQNYRPISLLSSIGKIVERLIHTRLSEYVNLNNILPDEQFGFRPKHSTTDQLLRVVEYAQTGFEWKQVTGAVFLDISKAFDTVWHDGLVFKLHEARVPPPMCQLIHSFLLNRSFQAKISNAVSAPRDLEAGVPQGSVLSPLLYAIYTADIPKPDQATLAVYADDTAILARSKKPELATRYLQVAVDRLEDWCSKWLIKVNPEKSSAILISRRRVNPSGHVQMFGEDIPWDSQVKYLGVVLDKRLTFDQHLAHAIQKGKMVLSRLSPLLSRRSKMSIPNKLTIFKSIVRPTLTYASASWAHGPAPTSLYRLQVLQNTFLRQAFNAPWFVRNSQLHREANLPPLKEFLHEIALKTLAKAEVHPNRLVREALNYDHTSSRYKRPKLALGIDSYPDNH